MKTPVQELFEKLWDADKDKFTWNAILIEMLEKEKEVIQKVVKESTEQVTTISKYLHNFFANDQ